MDYKLRVKGLEFLDPETGRWRPYAEIDPRGCRRNGSTAR